jgi:CheY-like chemotaxis protein
VTSTVTPRLRPAPKRLLLVDDHADAREMYAFFLKADGHAVSEAADGDQALQLIARELPDVAVIDISLPGMDGHELARRIRSLEGGAGVTLIALTGHGLPEDRERSRQAGFDRHLVKPVAPDQLRDTLNTPRRGQAPSA